MSASKRKCICRSDFCRSVGGVGELRVPKDRFAEYQEALGLQVPITLKDPRVWIGHFPQADIVAREKGVVGTLEVTLGPDALPIQTDEQIRTAHDTALGQLLRSEATNKYLRESLVTTRVELNGGRSRIAELEAEVGHLRRELEELTKAASKESAAPVTTRCEIDETILDRLDTTAARSLCGLRSSESLQALHTFLNAEGGVDNLNFYNANVEQASGLHADGTRVVRRKKKLGGANGLFFALMVLRTGVSLRVASTLFGVSEATGGRAFTAWLDFLANSLRPVVHLPEVGDVVRSAPPNFRRKGLSSVALVFDATEYEVDKTWQTDAARALWSQYKNKYTAKLLVCVTPSGMIAFVSEAFAGRTSDVELVKQCGIMEKLEERSFGHKGMQIMADRGFNSIAPLLLKMGMHYVAPPHKRKGEEQFSEEDAGITRDVANLRIHVERAIGAMRQWRILDNKFDSQQMDNVGEVALICAALVNLTRKPFASVD